MDVIAHGEPVHLELGRADVVRVVTVLADVLDVLLPAHPPAHTFRVGGEQLHQGRAPAAGTDHRNASDAHHQVTLNFSSFPSRSTVTTVCSPLVNLPRPFM